MRSAICTGDLNELTRQPHSIHKPPGCIGVFESQPARVSREIGGRAMPAVDIFIALMGLASAASPAAALRPWAGCTRSSLLEVRMNGTG